ncbi:MAG: 3-oxoacyl-ACP synthase [Flavicella sp.]|nr:3-oxoacyl-ACP synthase [Flavicella sp.]
MKEHPIKKALFAKCEAFVSEKIDSLEKGLQSHQKALASEIKSSAGDKHETGRAMLQLEMEKSGQQLQEVLQLKVVLEKISLEQQSEVIRLGSLVITNRGIYFLAISMGMIVHRQTTYFAVSPSSPIGNLLLGKRIGENILFQGKQLSIEHFV